MNKVVAARVLGPTKATLSSCPIINEILVIGGNESDTELISNIPNNYVVDNASKDLKKIARKKTTSNNNHGVEKVLKHV